jgi:hypothetical protein
MLQVIYGRICERLEAMGLGHREACRRAGLSLDSIRNIKRAIEDGTPGRRGVSTRTIAALAPVLGTSIDWLLDEATGTEAEGGGLAFVDWAEVGLCLDASKSVGDRRSLGKGFGVWPEHYFATRAPDEAMNRISPTGSYILVDRMDRSLIEGRCYLGLLDGQPLYRRWSGEPERAEPYSTDPAFKTEFLGPSRCWQIIGRVQRTILDV